MQEKKKKKWNDWKEEIKLDVIPAIHSRQQIENLGWIKKENVTAMKLVALAHSLKWRQHP